VARKMELENGSVVKLSISGTGELDITITEPKKKPAAEDDLTPLLVEDPSASPVCVSAKLDTVPSEVELTSSAASSAPSRGLWSSADLYSPYEGASQPALSMWQTFAVLLIGLLIASSTLTQRPASDAFLASDRSRWSSRETPVATTTAGRPRARPVKHLGGVFRTAAANYRKTLETMDASGEFLFHVDTAFRF